MPRATGRLSGLVHRMALRWAPQAEHGSAPDAAPAATRDADALAYIARHHGLPAPAGLSLAAGVAVARALANRPALVLEHFDRPRQPAIDALHPPGQAATPADVDSRTDALLRLGGPGWPWAQLRPVLRLAVLNGRIQFKHFFK